MQSAKRRKPAFAAGIESIASVRHVVVRQGECGRETGGREVESARRLPLETFLIHRLEDRLVEANARALWDTRTERIPCDFCKILSNKEGLIATGIDHHRTARAVHLIEQTQAVYFLKI